MWHVELHLFGNSFLSRVTNPGDAHDQDQAALALTFVSELESLEDDLIIVLDDLHLARASEAVFSFLDAVIMRLPSNVHFIITSRMKLPLHVARLLVNGETTLVSQEDLKFSIDEIQAFMRMEYHLSLPDGALAQLTTLTEGWAASIVMLGELLRHCPESERVALIQKLAQAPSISEYLAQEVFSRQPQFIQDFLIRTSILSSISPTMADELLGLSNSRKILEYLEENLLFTSSEKKNDPYSAIDDEVAYRYHHLFSHFLKK